jgi:multidrug resistance efflux pump
MAAPSPVAPAVAAPAKLAEADASAGLMALLTVENEARAARSLEELRHLIANETRKLTRARQIFVVGPARKSPPILTISGLPLVERSSPLVQGLEQAVAGLENDAGLAGTHEFDLFAYAEDDGDFVRGYPFRAMLWTPLRARGGENLGGLLLAREQAWTRSDILIAKRLAGTYAHAMALLIAEPRLAARLASKVYLARYALIGAGLLAMAALAIPVPMTTLAPFEITPDDPVIVAAPIEGVIDEILVEPSDRVTTDQVLVRFADTALRNRLDVATREMAVAEARLKQATQLAFNDMQGRHDMSVARAEWELKTAERDFARSLFDRAVIKAPRAGVAVYADKKSMVGRPVAVGERLMQIADPAHVEATIDVAVGDAIALQAGAAVKLFLDSDPLNAQAAKISEADYLARPRPGNVLAYRVVARFDTANALPRLGARGTAQIYGDNVLLAYYLFRRPIAALRQWVGL